MWWRVPNTVIAVSTGPAHGTNTAPRPRPKTNADPPATRTRRGQDGRRAFRAPFESRDQEPDAEDERVTRNQCRAADSAGGPSALSTTDPRSLMSAKLTTSPADPVTARRRRAARGGRRWRTGSVQPTKTTGKMGRMQGEMPAIRPATNPMSQQADHDLRRSCIDAPHYGAPSRAIRRANGRRGQDLRVIYASD